MLQGGFFVIFKLRNKKILKDMKKLWTVASTVITMIGIIDYTIKLFSAMDFLTEWIWQILGAVGATYLIVTGLIDYLKKYERDRQQQQADKKLTNKFLKFKETYDGLSTASGQQMKQTMLNRHFSQPEIASLVRQGLITLQVQHVF